MFFQQNELLATLTKYKHHGADERNEACSLVAGIQSVSNSILGAVVPTHGVIRRGGAWRARCGVGDHCQSQRGQEHKQARRVQQGFASRPVH